MGDEHDSWLSGLGVNVPQALGDIVEGDFDLAAGAGAKLASVYTGGAAYAASAVGADGAARELSSMSATADADSQRYFGEAMRDYGDAGAQMGWNPPGYPFPTPPPVPDKPPDLPPDSGPVPVPP